MGKHIMIMAGGTGGHVFPALAVALSLRDKGWQISWMGSRKGLESSVVPENGIDIEWLNVSGIRGKGRMAIFKAPVMLIQACLQAMQILKRRRPDVLLGMGGFVAGPGGLVGKLLRIPLVIHEQNRVPGTTNRLLAKFANVVLEAFPESFPNSIQAVCTGNPLRQEFIKKSHQSATSVASKPHKVLVVGGSLGAKILNEVVPHSLAQVHTVEIIHQTGEAMFDQVLNLYTELGIKAKVKTFIKDMAAAYQWADLIICRSGAMTVSEIAGMGLPSILIPYPYAVDDHQTANAKFLVEAQAGVMLAQANLNAESLAELIMQHGEKLPDLSAAARACARLDATDAVVANCEKMVQA